MTLNHTDTAMVEINNQKMRLMFHVAIAALLLAVPYRAFAAEPKPGAQTAQKLTVKA